MYGIKCDEVLEFHLQLRAGTEILETTGKLRDGPVSVREFLPMLRNLTDGVMDSLSRQAQTEGKQISCKAGCGACCRQVVPISEAEALTLIELIGVMPEERRTAVLTRFEAARLLLGESGILEKLRASSYGLPKEDRQAIGLDYFRLNIPCPFLEGESCSIHPDRPIACREYLVTSLPESCNAPGPQIAMVEVPRKLSNLLFRIGGNAEINSTSWLPLILAVESAPRLRKRPEMWFPGTQLLEAVVEFLNH